eukprot:CAMPEP_0184494086 /NCGR_PEP_ID=MMETSP0113_2-20130426/27741_1 /TAXON_ID=91329 /ORGANISM="Norrisiella sphaerica, Strain BC52" /LENGTH=495 /DNA_ID=CAMNT_0026879651 /DNA_START=146 /DNA_END=1633 /DNA_ORIENTATION=-
MPNDTGLSNPPLRKAIVIGAGIAGVCTAHQLARKGLQVTIIDSSHGFGAECSRAAAGGMQRINGSVDAKQWVATMRAFAKLAVPSFLRPDSFFPWFSLGSEAVIDPHFWRWMRDFSMASLFTKQESQDYKGEHMLKFTCWAISAMDETMSRSNYFGMDLGAISDRRVGALKLLKSQHELESIKTTPSEKRWGYGREKSCVLSNEDVLKMEPWLLKSLKFGNGGLFGALYQPEAIQANCEWYTQALGSICTNSLGVKAMFNTKVVGFSTELVDRKSRASDVQRISKIVMERGMTIEVEQDTAVVIACGSWTPRLLRHLQLYCPIYPLKGYNILVDLNEANAQKLDVPSRIVSDSIFYVTRYHDQLRMTSMGEFSGWGTIPTPVVEERMRSEAKRWFPELNDAIENSELVCGLRPLTADGMLLLGAIPGFENSFVNAGPGSNGWKVGIGAGEILARRIAGDFNSKTNSLSSKSFTFEMEEIPFDQNIFALSGRVLKL